MGIRFHIGRVREVRPDKTGAVNLDEDNNNPPSLVGGLGVGEHAEAMGKLLEQICPPDIVVCWCRVWESACGQIQQGTACNGTHLQNT